MRSYAVAGVILAVVVGFVAWRRRPLYARTTVKLNGKTIVDRTTRVETKGVSVLRDGYMCSPAPTELRYFGGANHYAYEREGGK